MVSKFLLLSWIISMRSSYTHPTKIYFKPFQNVKYFLLCIRKRILKTSGQNRSSKATVSSTKRAQLINIPQQRLRLGADVV